MPSSGTTPPPPPPPSLSLELKQKALFFFFFFVRLVEPYPLSRLLTLRALSGESGAGKTESAKYMIRQIIRLSHTPDGASLEKKIIMVSVSSFVSPQRFFPPAIVENTVA